MNANELAEWIEKSAYGEYDSAKQAATMLRQQQAEIEALKAGKIRAYDNGVEDGRKPNTNNEPVAWIGETLMGRQYINGQKDELPVGTALYTHPVKDLTDEEIENECRKAWGLHDQNQLNLEEVFKFARAILRKAQEK